MPIADALNRRSATERTDVRAAHRSFVMDTEAPHIAILQDLRLQSFDGIRFASYRTASKLRYIQKSTNCECVPIGWNCD